MRISSDAPPGASRRRRWLVWTIIAIASLITFIGSFTVWVRREVLNTDAWVAASSKLLANEDIRNALSISMVDTLFTKGNVQGRLEQRLPPAASSLAAPIAGFLEQQAVPVANELLQAPRTQALWADINRRVHSDLVAILENKPTGRLVTTGENGDVVLDLTPLIQRLAGRLGLSPTLPPGTGNIVILKSDQLDPARTAVRGVKVLSTFIALVVVALYALAVYLARGFRRRALRTIGIELLVIGVLLLVVRRLVGHAIVNELTSDVTDKAGLATWLIATGLLKDVATLLLGYGALAVVGAWLAGPGRAAVAVRRWLAPLFHRHALLVYAGVFLAYLAVLLWGPAQDTRKLVGSLVFGVLVAYGVYLIRRQAMREFPAPEGGSDEERPPPVETPGLPPRHEVRQDPT
jgi:hypothetical protein